MSDPPAPPPPPPPPAVHLGVATDAAAVGLARAKAREEAEEQRRRDAAERVDDSDIRQQAAAEGRRLADARQTARAQTAAVLQELMTEAAERMAARELKRAELKAAMEGRVDDKAVRIEAARVAREKMEARQQQRQQECANKIMAGIRQGVKLRPVSREPRRVITTRSRDGNRKEEDETPPRLANRMPVEDAGGSTTDATSPVTRSQSTSSRRRSCSKVTPEIENERRSSRMARLTQESESERSRRNSAVMMQRDCRKTSATVNGSIHGSFHVLPQACLLKTLAGGWDGYLRPVTQQECDHIDASLGSASTASDPNAWQHNTTELVHPANHTAVPRLYRLDVVQEVSSTTSDIPYVNGSSSSTDRGRSPRRASIGPIVRVYRGYHQVTEPPVPVTITWNTVTNQIVIEDSVGRVEGVLNPQRCHINGILAKDGDGEPVAEFYLKYRYFAAAMQRQVAASESRRDANTSVRSPARYHRSSSAGPASRSGSPIARHVVTSRAVSPKLRSASPVDYSRNGSGNVCGTSAFLSRTPRDKSLTRMQRVAAQQRFSPRGRNLSPSSNPSKSASGTVAGSKSSPQAAARYYVIADDVSSVDMM